MAAIFRNPTVTRWLQWALPIVAIVAVGLWYFGTYYEWVQEKERGGMTGEARENPYFAAQLLLEQLGFNVEKITDAQRLLNLEPEGTMFLVSPRSFYPDQARRLAEWVKAGGHLVVATDNNWLNTELGVYYIGNHNLAKTNSKMQIVLDGRAHAVDLPNTALLGTKAPILRSATIEGGNATWFKEPRGCDCDPKQNKTNGGETNGEDDENMDSDNKKESAQMDDETTAKPERFVMLHLALGKGRVTAISNQRLFNNHEIGNHDHAEYMARLFTLVGKPGTVYIAPDPVFPSLFEWLKIHAWAALAAASVLLFALLWRAMPRFGPIETPPPPNRPGLREHLRAIGEFHLKGHDFEALLAPMRDDCLRALQLHATREGAAVRPSTLAQRLTGLPQNDIEHALRASATDRTEFLRLATTLARIRDSLTPSQQKLTTAARP